MKMHRPGSLEPVYGILAAVVLLQEYPNGRELLGGGIILARAFYVTVIAKRKAWGIKGPEPIIVSAP